jgi:hypothetical protein
LNAENCQTGESLARKSAEANKEDVLRPLDQSATQIRQQLGESLASINNTNTALAQATTTTRHCPIVQLFGEDLSRPRKRKIYSPPLVSAHPESLERFRKVKEINGLRGGVLLYAAQENPQIDTEIAEKSRFRMETSY